MKNEQYLKKKSHKGIFISFEGGEGVGKSTQIILLKNYFTFCKYWIKIDLTQYFTLNFINKTYYFGINFIRII